MSATGNVPWEVWRSELAGAASFADLRSRLLRTAQNMAKSLPRGSVARSQWFDLGIRVLNSKDIESDGACMYRPQRSVVLVRANNNYKRQRFTTAHEVGHLLLGRVRDAGRLILTWEEEERLCDEFASLVLLPPDEVVEFMTAARGLESPTTVLNMARHFGVNLHPAIIALARNWGDERQILAVAELRGHPRRPSEVDYRTVASAGFPYEYLPRNQRLQSMGLGSLSDWARAARDREGKGRCHSARIKFWAPRGPSRSGELRHLVEWDALLLGNGLLIALLDVERASVIWSKHRAANKLNAAA